MKNLLIATIGLITISCYDLDEFNRMKVDSSNRPSFHASSSNDTILADGVDEVILFVTFPDNSDRDKLSITFKTTQGQFKANGSKEITVTDVISTDSSRVAVRAIMITSTIPGINPITYDVANSNFKRETALIFEHALPTKINAETNKFSLNNSFADEIQLKATLSRVKGKASKGTSVEFIVADTLSTQDENDNQYFRALNNSDESGLASVFLSGGAFEGFEGEIKYIAKTLGADLDSISAEGTFRVNNVD